MSTEAGPGPVRHRAPRRAVSPALWSRMWVRNTAAAMVVVAAVAAAGVVDPIDRARYAGYLAARFPPQSTARGQTVTVDGRDWTLREVKKVSMALPNRTAAPKGSAITVVRVERTGTPDPSNLCRAFLVEDSRRWPAETTFGSPYWVKPPDDGTTGNCNKPGPLQLSFLVPDDAHPTALELVDIGGTVMMRLAL